MEILTRRPEQLMGAEALNGTSAPIKKRDITDPAICRSYLVGLCYYDHFNNTKADKGTCSRIHDENLKAEYDAASEEQKQKWGFEFDCMHELGHHINECNRLIDNYEKHLEKTPEEIRKVNELLTEIKYIEDNIYWSVIETKVWIEIDNIPDACIEAWRNRIRWHQLEEKRAALKAIQDTAGPSGHQKLQVCDVCGAYLSRLDNDRRLADHFYGKMHLGYAQMRKVYADLQEKLKNRRPPAPSYRDDGYPSGPRDRDMGNRRGGGGYRGSYHGGRGRRYNPY